MVKNISKATNQQLYSVAKDETARLKERYAAARELQKRKEMHQMANPICPKCQTEGQVINKFQNTIVIECPICANNWKTESMICPKCNKPNGYAVDGLCTSCYGESRHE